MNGNISFTRIELEWFVSETIRMLALNSGNKDQQKISEGIGDALREFLKSKVQNND